MTPTRGSAFSPAMTAARCLCTRPPSPPVRCSALGQRVEFGVAEGRRGVQALQVRLLEPPPTVAKTSRKSPDEMIVIVEDLIKLLDGLSASYRRGRHPDGRDAKKIAAVLRAVADDVEPACRQRSPAVGPIRGLPAPGPCAGAHGLAWRAGMAAPRDLPVAAAGAAGP